MTQVIDRPTLVLNRAWQPVNVTPLSRALVLVYIDAARVVDVRDFRLLPWVQWAEMAPAEGEPFVQSVRQRLRAPEVISLRTYDHLPEGRVAFSRRNLFKRDGFTCQYCGRNPGAGELSIDHVLPRSRGGVSSWENCVLACTACNKRKADRTPAEAGMRLMVRPKRPRWRPQYAARAQPPASWSLFVSEAYWNVELES